MAEVYYSGIFEREVRYLTILLGEAKVFEAIMWYLEPSNASNYEIKPVFSAM